MTFDEYQDQALTTVARTGDDFKDLLHFTLGLNGEAGEVAEKIKKIIRDKGSIVSEEDKAELSKELGDVLWYIAVFAEHIGISLDKVAEENLAKLKKRKAENKISGSGDNR